MASSTEREGKRSRLGSRIQRAIYKSAHAWKHPWFSALSAKAHGLNNKSSSSSKEPATLDKAEQARIDRERMEFGRQQLRTWGVLR